MPANSRIVPTEATPDRPSKTIKVNGSALPPTFRVLSVAISYAAHKIPEAVLQILDGSAVTETFASSDEDHLLPGNEIEINAGYHGLEKPLFKGIIVKHGIKILQGQSSVLEITAKHHCFKSNQQRKKKIYEELKDSDVFEQILMVPKEIEATEVTHETIIQPNCTDWDFINMRAEANGMFVCPRFDKVTIKKPDLAATEVLELFYGSSILELESEIDVRDCFEEVKVQSWSYANQELGRSSSTVAIDTEAGNFTLANAASAIDNESKEVYYSLQESDQLMQVIADAHAQRSGLSKIVGRAKCIGFADIWPGDMLKLNGIGQRFIGRVFVTGVQQTIREGRWDTNIEFGWRKAAFGLQFDDISPLPALGSFPATRGLQIGIVEDLEDPQEEGRVRIYIPAHGGMDTSIWARVAMLDAGKERGTYFLPEVGDEVLVGFLDASPQHPVVLGAMHSSAKPATVKASNDNHIKGIYSREKMKLQFDDDKKEIIIDTPAGNSFQISEDAQAIIIQDQHSNKIVMDSNGISLESSKEINLKAGTGIKIEAGTNLELNATAQLKASGSAGSEFSSSSIVTIKGSMVMIN